MLRDGEIDVVLGSFPVGDAPPLRRGLVWRTDGATARVRAFVRAAHDLAGEPPG